MSWPIHSIFGQDVLTDLPETYGHGPEPISGRRTGIGSRDTQDLAIEVCTSHTIKYP